jgi:hypothetical protein
LTPTLDFVFFAVAPRPFDVSRHLPPSLHLRLARPAFRLNPCQADFAFMSVFISWGEKESMSHNGALLLQKWLPEILPNLETFVSSEDIASGALWLQKLFEQLEKSESGILCLTKEVLDRNWILFEAGALAKRAGTEMARVCPLLFEFTTLNFPLAAFQAHALNSKDEPRSSKEMLLLVKMLNNNRTPGLNLGNDQLERQFARCWPEFWGPYGRLCERGVQTNGATAAINVTNEEILVEMRGAFRQFGDALTDIQRRSTMNIARDISSDLQEFLVDCPVCKTTNAVLMPDRAGETKPTLCAGCGARFNAHITGSHSVLARPTRAIEALSATLPVVTETLQCPSCGSAVVTDLPTEVGSTRVVACEECRSSVYVHRSRDGVVARVPRKSGSAPSDDEWSIFLRETQAWVDPATLPDIIVLLVEIAGSPANLRELTAAQLCKEAFDRVDAGTGPKLSRTAIRTFVKLTLLGGAFDLPPEAASPWQIPFMKRLTSACLIEAYVRGAVHRLRTKFTLDSNSHTDLAKLLFPENLDGADKALKETLENEELT